MILDSCNEFADATTIPVTFGDGDVVIGNMVPLGATTNYPGHFAKPLYCVLRINTAVTSGGSATVTFKIQSAAAAVASGATLSSPTTHWTSDAIAKATLVAGYTVFAGALPGGAYAKYLGVTGAVGTATLTAGKLDAFLTDDYAEFRAYADAI